MAKVTRRTDNETIDHMILRFRREVKHDGIMAEVRKRESYLAPSATRKKKHLEAIKAKKHGGRH